MNIKYHWLVACFTVLLQLSENYPICQPMACDQPAVTEGGGQHQQVRSQPLVHSIPIQP